MSQQQIVVPRDQVSHIGFDGHSFKITWQTPDGESQTVAFQMNGQTDSFPSTDALEYTLATTPCGKEDTRIEDVMNLLHQVRTDTGDPRSVPLFLLPHMCTACPASRRTLLQDLRSVLGTEEEENGDSRLDSLRQMLANGNWKTICQQYESVLVRDVTDPATGQLDEQRARNSLWNMVPDFLWSSGGDDKERGKAQAARLAEQLRAEFRRKAREKVGGAILAAGRISIPSAPTLKERLKHVFEQSWRSLKWLLSAVTITLILGAVIWLLGPLTGGGSVAAALHTHCPILSFVLRGLPATQVASIATSPVGMYSLVVGSLTMATQGGLFGLVVQYLERTPNEAPESVWSSVYAVLAWPSQKWDAIVTSNERVREMRRKYTDKWWWRLARGVLVAMPLMFITGYMYATLVQVMIMIALPLIIGALFLFRTHVSDYVENMLREYGILSGHGDRGYIDGRESKRTSEWTRLQSVGWELLVRVVRKIQRPFVKNLIRLHYMNSDGSVRMAAKWVGWMAGLDVSPSYHTTYVHQLNAFQKKQGEGGWGAGPTFRGTKECNFDCMWKKLPLGTTDDGGYGKKMYLHVYAKSIYDRMRKEKPFDLQELMRTGRDLWKNWNDADKRWEKGWDMAKAVFNLKSMLVSRVATSLREPLLTDLPDDEKKLRDEYDLLDGFLNWVTRPRTDNSAVDQKTTERVQGFVDTVGRPVELTLEAQRDIMFGFFGFFQWLTSSLFSDGDGDDASAASSAASDR